MTQYPEFSGKFLNRQPLRGRFPRQRASGETLDREPLSFFRGDTIRFGVQVFDETGTVWNLDDVDTIKCTWKEQECLLQTTLELELGDGIEVVDAENGRIEITVSADMSANLLPISYVFDVEITMSDGTVGTVLKRYVEIKADVTETYPPPELA